MSKRQYKKSNRKIYQRLLQLNDKVIKLNRG